MRKYKDELLANGCELAVEDVKEELQDLLASAYPAWSIDELLLHPTEGIKYCDLVRKKLQSDGLPEDLILGCLLSSRKSV